jgi:DNA-binding NarL/FixJ family response regulator
MTSRPPIRVLIVDDHPAVRSGLARLVADAAGLQVIASEATAHDALTAARTLRVDVAVVDYRLPDQDGLALARAVKALPHPPWVLIYSAYADHALALAAIIAGADGTLSKSTVGEDLVRVIVAMAAGRTQHPDPHPSVARAVAQHVDERDLPILAMLLNHVPPTEIADALQISQGWLEARRWAMLQRIVRATNAAYPRGLTDKSPGQL